VANREILYLALTRPALWYGVPIEALALNMFVCFFAGAELSAPTIWRCPVWFWAASVPIHFGLRRLTGWNYHWARECRLWLVTFWRPSLYSLSIRPPKSGRDISSHV